LYQRDVTVIIDLVFLLPLVNSAFSQLCDIRVQRFFTYHRFFQFLVLSRQWANTQCYGQ